MKRILIGTAAVLLIVAAYFAIPKTVTAPMSGVATSTAAVTETSGSIYYSVALGVQFQFDSMKENTPESYVKEVGNKIYVYIGTTTPESGQSLEAFSKKSNETFAESIKRQILAHYPSPDCKVEVTPSSIQDGYQVAEISYPKPTNSNDPWFAKLELCNAAYDKTNGIRYFLYDPKHPDKFLFLDIGQYSIMGHDTTPWQDTITFI